MPPPSSPKINSLLFFSNSEFIFHNVLSDRTDFMDFADAGIVMLLCSLSF